MRIGASRVPWAQVRAGFLTGVTLILVALAAPNRVLAQGNVASVDAGRFHACAVTDSGAAYCWGKGGALGDGTNDDRNLPVPVVGLSSGVIQVSAGETHTCAVVVAQAGAASGGAKCWGWNGNGELGTGNTLAASGPVDVVVPVNNALLPLEGVASIATGRAHTCALTTSGGVKCWGSNQYGQIGNGTTSGAYDTPVDVYGLTSGVVKIGAGRDHTCALQEGTGAVFCWGRNHLGQLGDGTAADASAPTHALLPPVGSISDGPSDRTCATPPLSPLPMPGFYCWGDNSQGGLGNGSSGGSSPVPAYVVPYFGNPVGTIAVGGGHTCAVTASLLGEQTIVHCWGSNLSGQLGTGMGDPFLTTPQLVEDASPSTAVSAGGEFSCGLTAAGELKCWGSNQFGQLGTTIGVCSGTGCASPTPLTVTVGPAPTTTTLVASLVAVYFGQAVTFTATVTSANGPPTGDVEFFDGTTSLGRAALGSGQAVLTTSALAVGIHSITAKYPGDPGRFLASTSSSAVSVTVYKAPSATSLEALPTSAMFGQEVTLTATVTAFYDGTPTGNVEFFDGTTLLGPADVSSGAAVLRTNSLAVGLHSISAKYLGDGNFLAGTSAAVVVTVARAQTTTTLVSSANPAVTKQVVTITATVAPVSPGSDSPSGQVQLKDGNKNVGTVTLSNGVAIFELKWNGPGQNSLTAIYGGDANFEPSTSGVLTQTVNKPPPK